MNFKKLLNKLFNNRRNKLFNIRRNELTEEENDYINEFKGLFEECGYDGTKYNGIPRLDMLLTLLNIDVDDPIAKAVDAAWKEHFEYLEFKERLRNIISVIEPPQFDKYSQKMNEFKDLSDEELERYIEKYENEAVKSRDVKSLRLLSSIVSDMHDINKYWS